MVEYRHKTPFEWLLEHRDEDEVKDRLWEKVLPHVDSDTIQDVFEDLMDRDGYFKPVRHPIS